jgi:pyrrolysine biosynthesis protein PylD
VAFCPRQGKTVDNSRATARGYVAGLDLMAGGLGGRAVLVLGCGPVGRWVVEALLMLKARVTVVDRVAEKAADLAAWARVGFHTTIRVAVDAEPVMSTLDLIVDATNAADLIDSPQVTAGTLVAAPGMPCGVTPRAREKLAGRILHDPLQIGVAAMACEALCIIRGQAGPLIPARQHGESA